MYNIIISIPYNLCYINSVCKIEHLPYTYRNNLYYIIFPITYSNSIIIYSLLSHFL